MFVKWDARSFLIMGMSQLSGTYPLFFRKSGKKFCYVYASIIIDRGKAWVMPESKYSIGG